jgi:hypothetical protein
MLIGVSSFPPLKIRHKSLSFYSHGFMDIKCPPTTLGIFSKWFPIEKEPSKGANAFKGAIVGELFSWPQCM